MSLRLNKGDDNFVFISVFISNYITIKKKTIILDPGVQNRVSIFSECMVPRKRPTELS